MGLSERTRSLPEIVSAAKCKEQLQRIVDSSEFAATNRGRRFLSYVVEETLAGRAERIRAYSVAMAVFGRDASFEPKSDPIVRIEAGQLRRALERYYLTAGISDPVVITIPKGGYVPVFAARSTPIVSEVAQVFPKRETVADFMPRLASRRQSIVIGSLAAAMVLAAFLAVWPSAFWTQPLAPERTRVLVRSFDDLTGTKASAAIGRALFEEVIGQLSKFRDIVVIESVDRRQDGKVPAPRFELAGSVHVSSDNFRLRVRLVNRLDGAVLWANSYDGGLNLGELNKAQADIARDVATTVAHTYGVIFQADNYARLERKIPN